MVSQSYENKFGIKLSDDQRISNLDSNGLIKTEELVQKIPLYNEKLDVVKKNENGNLIIEKRWITVKKEIEIPLKYEEIFINDKVFNSYSDKEKGEILLQIKSKISDVFSREKSDVKDNKQLEQVGSEIEVVDLETEEFQLNRNVVSETLIPVSSITMADQTGIQLASDQTGIQQASDQTGIQQASDQTGIQQASDQTGIQQASDQTGIQQASDQTGIQQASDQTGIQQASDQTGIQQASDQTGIQQASDQTGIQQASDQTGIQQASDQTGIQQASDQTGIQQASDQKNTQETIELWGEEIIIDKRIVKLAEIVVKKYQVNEKRKIDVDVYREKLTLKFPGNFKEEIF